MIVARMTSMVGQGRKGIGIKVNCGIRKYAPSGFRVLPIRFPVETSTAE